MATPWIQVEESRPPDFAAGPGYADFTWQALFACQVLILPYPAWFKLRWGFNAAVLFEEALERQKLFLESQYILRGSFGIEPPEYRTLGFRFVSRPGAPLLVAVVGKIKGRSRQEALESALAFYNEIKHTFPYDYTLAPARSREEYLTVSGSDILDESNPSSTVALVKRMEVPISTDRVLPFQQGFWHSAPRSHEPIWRLMASATCPVLLNVSLRSTILHENERARLFQSAEEIDAVSNPHLNPVTLNTLKKRYREHVERRLTPWMKFYYLQVQLASTHALDENLLRVIGSSLAITGNGPSLQGCHVESAEPAERSAWQRKIRDLDFLFTGSSLAAPRLSDMADLQEVFAAIRLPYSPPEEGLPDVTFAPAGNS